MSYGGASRLQKVLYFRASTCALLLALLAVSHVNAEESKSEQRMKNLYALHCMGCHGSEGKGLWSHGIPDFGQTALFAGTRAGREYLVRVPGVSQSALSDADVADLLNWVLRSFGGSPPTQQFSPFSAGEVARYRSSPDRDAVRRRKTFFK